MNLQPIIGNHSTLVYNKRLVRKPPDTDDDLITLGKELTVTGADGKIARY